MPLPNFFIIGAAKSGTTSLFDYLGSHPDVFLHPRKELRFFLDARFGRGIEWYRKQFPEQPQVEAVGESSNGYTKYPLHKNVPERMAETVPDAKLLYIVREPFSRIESHWRHRTINGDEWRPSEKAVRDDPIYTLTSLYGRQIQRYYALFPPENILVLEADTLFSDARGSLDEICDFLGVRRRGLEGYEAGNVSAERVLAPKVLGFLKRRPLTRRIGRDLIRHYRRSSLPKGRSTGADLDFRLSADLRSELKARFADDLHLLRALTGKDFPGLNQDHETATGETVGAREPVRVVGASSSSRRG